MHQFNIKSKFITLVLFLLFCSFAVQALNNRSYYYNKATFYYEKGDYYTALINYQKELEGKDKDDEVSLQIARCFYRLNKMEDAYKAFYDYRDQLTGLDVYMYANALNKIGNYKEAIMWYYKVPRSLADSIELDKKLEACRQASDNQHFTSMTLEPTRLADLGQSFGIQYYKKGVVFSYPEKTKKKFMGISTDYHGLEFQNLYYSDLKNNIMSEQQTQFSKNLRFPYHIGAISFSHHFTKIYYTKTVLMKGKEIGSVLKIYMSTYNKKAKDWTNEVELPINSDEFNCAHPAVSPDNKYLYFSSDRPGGKGGKDLYRVALKKKDTFGEVESLGDEINTQGDEMFPFISKSGDLYFASDGHGGYGGLDIFKAKQTNKKWGDVQNMQCPVNSSFDDFAYILNPSNPQTGYLSSDRNSQTDIIYVFNNSAQCPDSLISTVEDAEDGTPIENAKVLLTDSTTGKFIGQAFTDKFGRFAIAIPAAYRSNTDNYVIAITHPDYIPKNVSALGNELQAYRNQRIGLDKLHRQNIDKFSATIVDVYDPQHVIFNKEVLLRDNKTKDLIGSSRTDSTGTFTISIPEQYQGKDQKFDVTLTKELGYQERTMTVSRSELGYINKKGELDIVPENVNYPDSFTTKLKATQSGMPVEHAKLILRDDESGKVIDQTTTGKDGSFVLNIGDEYKSSDNKFELEIKTSSDYYNKKMPITISNIRLLQHSGMLVDEKKSPISIPSLLKSAKDQSAIFNAQVNAYDKKSGTLVASTLTDANGDFNLRIPDRFHDKPLLLQVSGVPGYNDLTLRTSVADSATLRKGIFLTPQDGYNLKIASTLRTTYSELPVAGAIIVVRDALTGEILGQTTSAADGSFVLYISDIYNGGKQFIVEIKKGNNIETKQMVLSTSELETLERDGILLTPIFDDKELDELNQMSIPHNKHTIVPPGFTTLDRLAKILKENPEIVIKLNGHTDTRGVKIDNLDISQARADEVKAYLLGKGVPDKNVIPRGYADRYLLNRCLRNEPCSEKEQLLNDRIEVVVWRILK